MKKWIAVIAFLSGCSTLPGSALRYSEEKATNLSEFELCRAYWDFDISNRQIEQSAIPNEMERRGLSGNACFDVLLAEHGVDSFCSRYNRAVLRGEPSALIGFATHLSRSTLQQGLEARDINCYTEDYLARSGNRESSGKSRVTEFFEDVEESFERRGNRTKTTCRETVYDTVECESSNN